MKYEDYIDVKLFSYTQINPDFVIEQELNKDTFTNAQELVAYCAKVSNPASQINLETSTRLIQYLIANAHWSPLEMVDATLEINTTRDIGRQIIRHKSFSIQEFSQRYQVIDDTVSRGMKFVTRQARRKDTKNRQNSIADIPDNIQQEWQDKQLEIISLVKQYYSWAIEHEIASECARVILPEGNTTSRIYLKGSLRSWIHYIELRSANGTQLEHMEIAKACAQAIAEIFPMVLEYIGKDIQNGRR
jgi:thymidylate synthase (FAD)